ncbi:MAG: DUF1028 domain-containing protein [Leptolyngbya sp. PLA3]|nr:MAG: DUF1028 domain-containing protein [Cyanobacteria bacterium CYA]MCE7970021.1 DUF1028 domain-containing protein [Leptolyngbya sp. PL-A3]
MRFPLRSLGTAALLSVSAGSAQATWSILIADTRTGEIGVASATCLFGMDLRDLTPLLITGVGGLTAQSYGDTSGQNRTFIRDRLLEGYRPEQIIDLVGNFDPGHQTRQYGLVDAQGEVATFTGSMAGAWAGGVTGHVGDLVYAVQGNVLTGQPVVALAEQAIISTQGDLPEKLMAAMEAAYLMGGDGRCSCNASLPESCGSPPPSFTKSAHIGYMLIARAGDFSAANGVYGIGAEPGAITTIDFDSDGRPDVASATIFAGGITLLRNVTLPGGAFTMLEPAGTLPGLQQPVAMLATDATGDGLDDLLVLTQQNSNLRLFQSDGAGTFTLALDRVPGALGGSRDLQCGMGGIVVVGRQDVFVLEPAGGLAQLAHTTLTPDLRSFAPDPGNQSAGYVANASGRIVRLVRSGDTISVDGEHQLGVDVVSLAAGDANADGHTDLLAVSTNAKRADLMLGDGIGGWNVQTFSLNRLGRDAMMADFDNDGDLDPAVISHGQSNLFIIRNDAGNFVMQPETPVARAPRIGVPCDMNGDGFPEVISGSAEAQGVVIGDNFAGRFAATLGAAAGDYFMQLNVADTNQADPDPVLLLRDQFDQWRAGLTGKVDAVQSQAYLDVMALPASSTRQAVISIRLLDWQADPVAGEVNLRVQPGPNSDGVSTVESIDNLGAGNYRVYLSAGDSAGTDRVVISADAGERRVELMPSLVLRVVDESGDFNADGTINFYDVQSFLRAFAGGEMSADLNTDGALDVADVELLLQLIQGA